ncbi:MAG: 2,3-bisphosphoglycerate-independent phosphoglycerate mutase [Magnetococcales bacterium]|nr:2,3-bisphosphoglycerate-independent phosphoglycerate mutase [Magnetococcales bacterium]
MRPKPMTLVIMDGWGIRDERDHNAIFHAKTPHFDHWWQTRPHALVQTSGGHVGLPDGQMGNSEVGHLNLGAGRIVYQDYTRINLAIKNNTFQTNPALTSSIEKAVAVGGAVHIMGLLSPGGVHSHTDHLLAAVESAAKLGAGKILVHGFLDGRDTPPRSAMEYISNFQAGLDKIGAGRIATLCGRYYAMDRDKRWDRVQLAYDMLVAGKGEVASDPLSGLQAAYDRGEDDEFVQPTLILADGTPPQSVSDGDAVLMLNFRADRVREMSHAFLDPEEGDGAFTGFKRSLRPQLSAFLCLTLYDETLQNIQVAFPPERLHDILAEEVSKRGWRQLRAAETEKYAHVTYFFNGGEEAPFPLEERLLIPSPDVATYDHQPAMSAQELTDRVIEKLGQGSFDLVVVNYANPDMVGHTGDFEAAVKAIETVDHCLGQLADAILKAGGELLLTADHGNADQMVDIQTNQAHTAHTLNPAPLLYLGRPGQLVDGRLCDVAPTLLRLMGLPQPEAMSGQPLVTLEGDADL